MGGNEICAVDKADDFRIRLGRNRDRPRMCKLSGTRRLGASYCGYQKRMAAVRVTAGKVWKTGRILSTAR
jgi:hypothetical protein